MQSEEELQPPHMPLEHVPVLQSELELQWLHVPPEHVPWPWQSDDELQWPQVLLEHVPKPAQSDDELHSGCGPGRKMPAGESIVIVSASFSLSGWISGTGTRVATDLCSVPPQATRKAIKRSVFMVRRVCLGSAFLCYARTVGASEKLEHAQHVAHSGHGSDPLSMRIGITMAILGVVLAFGAARVGAERTELTEALVSQQHAHANYQAQDIKHRVAILALQNVHAEAAGAGKTNAADMLGMANSAERYEHEAEVAMHWVDAYDAMIQARTESQEQFERGQLAAEIGIVIASIAILLKRRLVWIVAMLFGVASILQITVASIHVHHEAHEAEEKIEHGEKAFEELHSAGKTTAADHKLLEEIRREYGPASATPR